MASDALLLGRVTYEGFAAAWPSRDGEFADKFNGMQKYVVSSTIGEPEWNNTKVVTVDDVAALREDGGTGGRRQRMTRRHDAARRLQRRLDQRLLGDELIDDELDGLGVLRFLRLRPVLRAQ